MTDDTAPRQNILGLSGYDPATLNTVANAVADGLVGPGEWMPLSVRYRTAAKVLDAMEPIIRAEVAKARAEAWQEGYRAKRMAAVARNPYRTEQNDGR